MSHDEDEGDVVLETSWGQTSHMPQTELIIPECSHCNGTSVLLTVACAIIIMLLLFWATAEVSWVSIFEGKKLVTVDSDETQTSFKFPKKMWVFHNNKDYFADLNFQPIKQNHLQCAQKSKFSYQVLNYTNYQQFLSHEKFAQVSKTIHLCIKWATQKPQNQGLFNLCQQLIVCSVLLENGGVAISNQSYAFTKGLKWLENISSNPSVMRGSQLKKTEVVGFFDPRWSSDLIRIQTNDTIHSPYRYARQVVSIYPIFLAAVENSQFMHELCSQIVKSIELPYQIDTLNSQVDKRLTLQRQFHFLAITHRMMRRRQQQLSKTKNPISIASDSYGMSLINIFEGPDKLNKRTLQARHNTATRFDFLAEYSAEDLDDFMGTSPYGLRFLHFSQLEKVRQGRRKVMNGSYIHQLFQKSVQKSIYPNFQVSIQNTQAPLWLSLPRKLWVFWAFQFDKSSIVNRLALKIMKSKLESTGFQVTLVTLENWHHFVSEFRLKQIQSFINRLQPAAISDLIRLALLQKHGGIYMDISTFIEKDLKWIFSIARYPSKLFFNRFDHLPKALLQFYPFEGWSGQWNIDSHFNTKSQSQIGFENSFIAAEPNSEIINDWLNVFLEFISIMHIPQQLQRRFKQCGIHTYRWLDYRIPYLLAMDSLKCVMARKQKVISRQYRNACHYYGVWTFNGFYGPQKFRYFVEIENIYEGYSPLMVEYSRSYAELLVGKSYFPFVKMFKGERQKLSEWLKDSSHDKFSRLHPKSLLRNIMNEASIDIVRNQLTDELQIIDKK